MKIYLNNIKQNIAIILLIAYIFSRLSWGFVFSSLSWGLMLSVASILFILCILERRTIYSDKCNLCLALMLLIMVLNRNYDIRNDSTSGFLTTIFPIMCGAIAYIACVNNGNWTSFFKRLVVFVSTIYSTITLLCVLFPQIYYNFVLPILQSNYPSIFITMTAKPATGFTADYGMNSLYISIGFCISICYVYLSRWFFNSKKMSCWATLIISGMALLCNAKRSTFLGILVGFIVIYFLFEEKKGKIFRLVIIGLCLVAAILLASLLIPSLSALFDHIAVLSTDTQSEQIDSRSNLWLYAIKAFTESPLLGKGWRWFRYNNTLFGTRDVHNTFIQLLTENGIIGSLPFFIFFGISYKRAFALLAFVKRNRQIVKFSDVFDSIFCLMYQTFALIYMFMTTSFYSPNFVILYFIICAFTTNKYYKTRANVKTVDYVDALGE